LGENSVVNSSVCQIGRAGLARHIKAQFAYRVIAIRIRRLIISNTLANIFFYIHGSVHRESNLITVQQDAAYSVYYISVGSSTCFGCCF